MFLYSVHLSRQPAMLPALRLAARLRRAPSIPAFARGSATQPTPPSARDAPTALAVGLVSGSVGSFVGIGGALLMVPLSLRLFAMKQLQANASALLPNVATCVSGAALFHAAGNVDWVAAGLVAVSAAATTRVGARFAHKLPEATQKYAFGAALLLLGPCIAFKPLLQGDREAPEGSPAEPTSHRTPTAREAAGFVALGSCTGLASGVMGIGAGVMCTVGLAIGGPAWWSHHTILGTAFAAQLLPHATGAFTHWQLGNLRTDLVPFLVLGSALGSALASRVAVKSDDEALRWLFSAYTVALGLHSLRQGRALARR